MCAMAPGAPQTSPKDVWNKHEQRIENLIKQGYSQLKGENYSAALEAVRTKFFSNYSEKIWFPSLVDHVVKGFIREKRQQLWDAHKALVISNVQDALSPAAREFESYYTEVLLKITFAKFSEHAYPESWQAERFGKLLNELVEKAIGQPILELTNDSGELRDEELVRLYRAGFPKCKTLLLERYNIILRQLVPSIVYAKGICQESEDTVELIKDIAQETSLKLLAGLDTYRFESSFRTWVGTICENEAKTRQRKWDGRSKEGKRKYVSFEDMKYEPEASIPNEDRRVVLRKIIDKHRKQGPRAEKSSNAIEWRYFEGIETAAIAQRLQTTVAYVHQLFSHDYPELRRIALDDFGLSGTDL